MLTINKKVFAAFAAVFGLTLSSISNAALTDLANGPLSSSNNVKPNIIFLVDDSGSMDWEILMNTSSGNAWYLNKQSAVAPKIGPGLTGCSVVILNASTGALGDNCTAANRAAGVQNFFTSSSTSGWIQYAYLFPSRKAADARIGDNDDYSVVPMRPEFSYLRSSDYNPIFYNSRITYQPWANTANYTFTNANPLAVKNHPVITNGNTPAINLTVNQNPAATYPGFQSTVVYGAGYVFPSGTKYHTTGGGTTLYTLNSSYTVPENGKFYVVEPMYFPTFYNKDSTCTAANVTAGVCTTAPDGSRLRKYEIKSTTTYAYPSGRNYTDEMQNFANWFQYYRKRNLMLAGSMGQVLPQLGGVYVGVSKLSQTGNITMYDIDTQGFSATLNPIYTNSATNGTTTKAAMKVVGEQFRNNSNIIKFACQTNTQIVLTDGYASAVGPTIDTYNRNTYGEGAPYSNHFTNSLADTALFYYTTNLRPSITPTGAVPRDSTSTTEINPDFNSNLHLNTYAMTLGSVGLLYGNSFYGTGKEATAKAFETPPTWINPSIEQSPTSIDDLWHATINGRGSMFTATNPEEVKDFANNILGDILSKSQARAAVGVSTVNIKGSDNSVYVSSYNATSWYGELAAYRINTTNGQANTSVNPDWSAQKQLSLMVPANRLISTYYNNAGVEFTAAAMPNEYLNALNTTTTPANNADVINYLRGERTNELPNGTFRKRDFILGDIVNAEPVYVRTAIAQYNDLGYSAFSSSIVNRNPMIYQAANDGMIHAIDATNGIENYAYVPSKVIPNLKRLTNHPYSHLFFADGTPAYADVDFTNTAPIPTTTTYTPNWKTILVGGLRNGGKGFYALDITEAKVTNIAGANAKVLWEFPNASTPAATANNVGYSYGKPIITKTARHGWVVLVSSGYNNDTGDGKGHLFVLNARTGALIQDITTNTGSVATPSGLAHISAWTENVATTPVSDAAYGGDLLGNVWKFNLTSNPYSVTRIATLKDANNVVQPITTTVELGTNNQDVRMIFIGTGKTLGNSDLTVNSPQSIYGIVDDGTTIANVRSNSLLEKTVTVDADLTRHVSKENVNWSNQKGWYFDLPSSGERLNGDIQLVAGVIVFATNIPSPSACSSSGFLYAVNANNGGELASSAFLNSGLPAGVTYSGKSLGINLTSRPVLIQLPNGQVNGLLHNADNTILSLQLPTSTRINPRITSWKELLR